MFVILLINRKVESSCYSTTYDLLLHTHYYIQAEIDSDLLSLFTLHECCMLT